VILITLIVKFIGERNIEILFPAHISSDKTTPAHAWYIVIVNHQMVNNSVMYWSHMLTIH